MDNNSNYFQNALSCVRITYDIAEYDIIISM